MKQTETSQAHSGDSCLTSAQAHCQVFLILWLKALPVLPSPEGPSALPDFQTHKFQARSPAALTGSQQAFSGLLSRLVLV